ncbi:WAT1-related protein At5g64700-like isoform X1 [Dioscorea cayenensis subsp. rotundata]|uniref:WAT1-related protein n=2 Tax=Dioscorea cayennensis subsp. rotundata TaxID=55577 RepID=A0AB40CD94_DIOCR|nr:WAT1-related protein At5g64700-like isoform X1 [Dioscorea cayenensis subsp. rotundata]
MKKTSSLKLYLAIILIRTIYAGLQILGKAALDGGMNTAVFVFYRQALASVIMSPVAFFVEWKSAPPLGFKVGFKIFILALLGTTMSMNFHMRALSYTTPTLASAIINSIPAMTFILSVILRVESLKPRKLSGIAKIIGVVLSLAGVVVIALYIGPFIKSLNPHYVFGDKNHERNGGQANQNKKFWLIGTSLMTITNITWALWLVLQGAVLKEYPAKLMFTALQCIFSTVQSFFVALAMERDFSKWKLSSGMSFISVAYCGVIVTGVSFYLQSWCIEKRGPVFLSMFTPLTLLITMACSFLFLGDVINLGSILGGALMVTGLYSVLWGKSKEVKESTIPVAAPTESPCFDETQMVNRQKE